MKTKAFVSVFLANLVAAGITVPANAEWLPKPDTKPKKCICEKVDDSILHYTINKGDTLYNICVIFYGDGTLWEKVAEYNNIENVRNLHVGQEILLPKNIENIKIPTNEKPIVITPIEENEYVVQKGDNLTEICKSYYGDGTKATAWKLATYNGLKDPDLIITGAKLKMPDYKTLLTIVSIDYSKCEKPEIKPDCKPKKHILSKKTF